MSHLHGHDCVGVRLLGDLVCSLCRLRSKTFSSASGEPNKDFIRSYWTSDSTVETLGEIRLIVALADDFGEEPVSLVEHLSVSSIHNPEYLRIGPVFATGSRGVTCRHAHQAGMGVR